MKKKTLGAAAGGLALLAAGLLSCLTPFPPPAAGRPEAMMLVVRATLHGARLSGQVQLGPDGYFDEMGLKMSLRTLHSGEAARVRLRNPLTRRLLEPTRVWNGYCFFANVPGEDWQLESVEIDSGSWVSLQRHRVRFRVETGGAHYLGTYRVTLSLDGRTAVERAGAPEEQRDREAVAGILAAQGRGLWVLQSPPAPPPLGTP